MEKMQNSMMKMYQVFAWMGLIIVVIAFLFSFQGAGANAAFFAVDKATREAAGAGSALALADVTRHTVPIWVPYFKFLGLGIMLGSITMALGLIATTLRDLGKDVTDKWPAELNPGPGKLPLVNSRNSGLFSAAMRGTPKLPVELKPALTNCGLTGPAPFECDMIPPILLHCSM